MKKTFRNTILSILAQTREGLFIQFVRSRLCYYCQPLKWPLWDSTQATCWHIVLESLANKWKKLDNSYQKRLVTAKNEANVTKQNGEEVLSPWRNWWIWGAPLFQPEEAIWESLNISMFSQHQIFLKEERRERNGDRSACHRGKGRRDIEKPSLLANGWNNSKTVLGDPCWLSGLVPLIHWTMKVVLGPFVERGPAEYLLNVVKTLWGGAFQPSGKHGNVVAMRLFT